MFGQAAKSQNPSNGQERPLYDHSDDNRVSAPWIRAADEASPGCFRPHGPPNIQILAAIEIIWAFCAFPLDAPKGSPFHMLSALCDKR